MTTVKESPRKLLRMATLLKLCGLLVGLYLAAYFGLNTVGQWDMSTGRSRTVTTLVGIPIIHGKPKPTRLSELLNDKLGEEQWIIVRGPSPKEIGVKVTWCSVNLLNILGQVQVELEIAEKEGGAQSKTIGHIVAASVLHELSSSNNICDVYYQSKRFAVKLSEVVSRQSLTTNAVNQLWVESKDSQ